MKKENSNNLISIYHLNESDIDWEKIKSNLRKFYCCYDPDNPDNNTTKYKQYISNEIKLFHYNNLKKNYNDNTKELYDTSYDIGIFMIGFSDSPILMSLDVIRPGKIIFIYTEDSKTTLENMEEYIKLCNNSNIDYLKDVFSNKIKEKGLADVKDFITSGEKAIKINLGKTASPVDTFKTIKDIISDKSLKRIAVDITGGKKTMISGAFSSASLREDVDIIYVDNEEYNREQRRPEPGTEFISKLQNPNNIYRYTDMERIKGLFDSHRYDIASQDIEKQIKIMNKYRDKYYFDEIDKLVHLKEWADIYNDWDQYRYSVFFKHSEDIKKIHGLNDQDKLLLEKVAEEFNLRKASNPSSILQKIFENIINGKSDIEYYDRIFSFVAIDRYCNAKRRTETDNEGCIIRLCSIIELLTYYYLIRNHDNLEITCEDKNSRETIQKDKYVEIIFGNYPDNNLQNENYGVLQSVQSRVDIINEFIKKNSFEKPKYGKKYNFVLKTEWMNNLDNNEMSWLVYLEDIIRKRNKSSITHSIGSIEDEKVKEYIEGVRSFIKWVFDIGEKEFDDLENKIRFRKEAEITGFY